MQSSYCRRSQYPSQGSTDSIREVLSINSFSAPHHISLPNPRLEAVLNRMLFPFYLCEFSWHVMHHIRSNHWQIVKVSNRLQRKPFSTNCSLTGQDKIYILWTKFLPACILPKLWVLFFKRGLNEIPLAIPELWQLFQHKKKKKYLTTDNWTCLKHELFSGNMTWE